MNSTLVADQKDAAVLVDVTNGIARLTLNRPGEGNAIDLALAAELEQAVAAAGSDDRVRAIVLLGAGRLFCVGGDLGAMYRAADRGGYVLELATAAHRAVWQLATVEKPIVCAVQGAAAGAGLSLIMLADYVVTTPTAKFSTAYTDVGLTPDCGQSWLLPAVVGLRQAIELTMVPRRITATEALSLSLVSRIADDATREATELAEALATGPYAARGSARALLRRRSLGEFERHLVVEAATIARLAATEHSRHAIDRFAAATRGDK